MEERRVQFYELEKEFGPVTMVFDTGNIDILGMNYYDGGAESFFEEDPQVGENVKFIQMVKKDFELITDYDEHPEMTEIVDVLRENVGDRHEGSIVFQGSFFFINRILKTLIGYRYAEFEEVDMRKMEEFSHGNGFYYIKVKTDKLLELNDDIKIKITGSSGDWSIYVNIKGFNIAGTANLNILNPSKYNIETTSWAFMTPERMQHVIKGYKMVSDMLNEIKETFPELPERLEQFKPN